MTRTTAILLLFLTALIASAYAVDLLDTGWSLYVVFVGFFLGIVIVSFFKEMKFHSQLTQHIVLIFVLAAVFLIVAYSLAAFFLHWR